MPSTGPNTPNTLVTVKKIDEITTNKYRVEIEFYGVDAKNSLADVQKFAEWNLASNGAVVTSLVVKKISDQPVRLRSFEWSVPGPAVAAFNADPDGTLQHALAQAGVKGKPKYLPAPSTAASGNVAPATLAPDKRGGKCYDTTGEVPGVEVPCPAEPSGGGWHC